MAISTDSALPENRVKISEDFRSMNVPTHEQVLGCVGDAWVRRVWFDMPRYCDGTDLSGYTLSVNYRNSDDDEDRYPVSDATVSGDTITFSWLVGANACAYEGKTAVSVKAQLMDGDEVTNEFNSTIYYFKVLGALTTGAEPLQEYSDAFTTLMLQWQAEVDEAVAEAPKGKLIGTVDAVQAVSDAYPAAMVGATVYGKCVQDGTPTPSAPVPVQVVSAVNITINETVHAIDLQGHTLAGLPDGTRDVLYINSAGRVWIEQNVRPYDSSTANWYVVNSQVNSHGIGSISVGTGLPQGSFITYRNKSFANLPYGTTALADSVAREFACNGSNIFYRFPTSGTVRLNDALADMNDFAAVMYFPIATPQTIELGTITPPPIAPGDTLAIYASLDPEWAIQYEQDPNIVVHALQSSIAPVEGSTASANYAVNSYLIHGNQLYRVTSAIATGEAITPGSNCTACTVMGEVIRLTA